MTDLGESQHWEKLTAAAGAELEADVRAELQSIMRLYAIDVEELWYKWESYSMKLMGSDELQLTIDTARNLKKNIQDELERESRTKAHHLQSHKRGRAVARGTNNNLDLFEMIDDSLPRTPKVKGSAGKKIDLSFISKTKIDLSGSPSAHKSASHVGGSHGQTAATSFRERANAGQTVEILNPDLPEPTPLTAPFTEPRIKLTANSDMKKLSYKPMAMKSSDASEILDDKIDDFTTQIQKHYNLEDSEFGCAASQNVNEIVAVGRIASDSLDGKLNAHSLVLETSRRVGAGQRIPLKVEAIHNLQFFPGQIVALKGINVSGESFTVNEILEPPLLPSAASTHATLKSHIQRLKGGPDVMDMDSDPAPLNILVAAGPYTADDNLHFEPLHALCNHAADSYADALVLIGPFLDIDHPLIATGDFDLPGIAPAELEVVTMSTVFKYLVAPALTQLVTSNPQILIILVPSVKDAVSKHVSWPQEPFPRKDLGVPKSIKIVGNPMVISLNEISVGISSQDILTELRIAEVTGNRPKDPVLLTRLPKYLLEQRSFFPLFPPVSRDLLPKTGTSAGIPTGAMLDTSYLRLGDLINVRPDILLVPSALPPFAKVVESVVVINPGYLSKRKAAGTYAQVTIQPPSLKEEEGGGGGTTFVAHRVFERARVEILKI
ncbi:hypothetical protein K3495_g263 [Podosphaera aphanis]|nr:hypothetical protein K3495_g263 [Podosphaera aphanis]